MSPDLIPPAPFPVRPRPSIPQGLGATHWVLPCTPEPIAPSRGVWLF
jgi:hypothetical protein